MQPPTLPFRRFLDRAMNTCRRNAQSEQIRPHVRQAMINKRYPNIRLKSDERGIHYASIIHGPSISPHFSMNIGCESLYPRV
jgi:hypothetical protein